MPKRYNDSSPPISSVSKACLILRKLSDEGGLRLIDIAERTELDKATVRRLLETLEQDGLVARVADGKRYFLGPQVRTWSAAAIAGVDIRAVTQPSLLRLVTRFEDTTVVSIRRGMESVCLAIEDGLFPISARYVPVGSSRPLGAGASSLALLAWMPDDERLAAFELLPEILASHSRVNVTKVANMVENAREVGYALSLDVLVDQLGSIAVPVREPDGRPVAALCIVALSTRITSRLNAIAEALQAEAIACERRIVTAVIR